MALLELPIAGSLLELRVSGLVDGLGSEIPKIIETPAARLNGRGDFERVMRKYLRRRGPRKTLVGTVKRCLRVGSPAGLRKGGRIAAMRRHGTNALRAAQAEVRRPGTRLVGSIAYFPERYGDELIPLALNILQKKPTPSTIFVRHQLLTPRYLCGLSDFNFLLVSDE